jgi:hypothetical protein
MAPRGSYPPTYGVPTRAIPDILGPLNIDPPGGSDPGVPGNDLAEIPDTECPDPMAFVSVITRGDRRR